MIIVSTKNISTKLIQIISRLENMISGLVLKNISKKLGKLREN